MMNLVTIKSAKQSRITGWLELTVTADLGGGPQDYPYTYNPAENEGLNPAVTAWLIANPTFPIGEADPVPPPSTDPADYPLSMRQLRLGLKRFGDKPASFLANTIAAIADANARDEATIWYEETIEVHWSHPMTQTLIAAAGFTIEQAAAMWMQAKDIAA